MQDISTSLNTESAPTPLLVERCLPLNELAPGMTLSQDLRTASAGHLEDALTAGQVLTAATLDKLRRGHGLFACVWMADTRSPQAQSQARQQAQVRMDEIFEGADLQDPILATLKHILVEHRAQR